MSSRFLVLPLMLGILCSGIFAAAPANAPEGPTGTPVAWHPPLLSPLAALPCTDPPCIATSSISCMLESTSVKANPTDPFDVLLAFDVTNADEQCGGKTLDVHAQLTQLPPVLPALGFAIDAPWSADPAGGYNLMVPSSSTIRSTLTVSFPANAPVGVYEIRVDLTPRTGSFPAVNCTAKICVGDPNACFVVEAVKVAPAPGSTFLTANNCNFAGDIVTKSFLITNLSPNTLTLDYTLTSVQRTSSTTQDHFPVALHPFIPMGDPHSTTIPTLTGTVVVAPNGGTAEVVFNTQSFPACHGGSMCNYDIVVTESMTANTACARTNYLVITPGWFGCVRGEDATGLITAPSPASGSWGAAPRIQVWSPLYGSFIPIGTSFVAVLLEGVPSSMSHSQTQPTLMLGHDTGTYMGQSLPLDLANAGAPGMFLALDPVNFYAPTPPTGNHYAEVAFAVPNDPALIGLTVRAQWALLDPMANTLGLVLSPGARIWLTYPAN